MGATAGDVTVDVSSIGTAMVKDAYTGTVVAVTNGKATFNVTDANNGTLLIEAVK
jgi:proline racemase